MAATIVHGCNVPECTNIGGNVWEGFGPYRNSRVCDYHLVILRARNAARKGK